MWLRELLLNKLFLTVNLIKACRSISPNAKIIISAIIPWSTGRGIMADISAIIPRPVDHDVTDHIIGKINSYLHKTLSNELKFKFICTYKPFTDAGKVRRELYAIIEGCLHLYMEGTSKFRFFFLRVISTLSD